MLHQSRGRKICQAPLRISANSVKFQRVLLSRLSQLWRIQIFQVKGVRQKKRAFPLMMMTSPVSVVELWKNRPPLLMMLDQVVVLFWNYRVCSKEMLSYFLSMFNGFLSMLTVRVNSITSLKQFWNSSQFVFCHGDSDLKALVIVLVLSCLMLVFVDYLSNLSCEKAIFQARPLKAAASL